MLDEDHPPAKGEGTLRDQQGFQVLKGSREIGFLEEAFGLLGGFLRGDAHYRASSAAYGDGGAPALARAPIAVS